MENLIKNLNDLKTRVASTMRILDIERKRGEIGALKAEIERPEFWQNREQAVIVSQKADVLAKEVAEWDALQDEIGSLSELAAESAELGDDSLEVEAIVQYEKLLAIYERLEFFVMFSGKHDEDSAIISLHAGTGGVDAQDWAQILERMFLRFAEKMSWKTEIVDRTLGNEAGIKSSTYRIVGRWAYGYLKSESGVHRLVRISPFDAEAMRHTSFALVEVIPELPDSAEIEIADSDLAIDVFRSSGPGGQSVNTTDSAIRIRHIPSGIIVSCQNERSQHQNRETAMKILKAKLFKQQEEERESQELKLRGEAQKAEWGKQIRSYVMQPYKMVKDHRTGHETQEIDKVLDGDLTGFMEAYLRWAR